MQASLLTSEHRMFRDAFRRFVEQEISPNYEQWEKDGMISRKVWQKAGSLGFLCMDVPEEYGGGGTPDFRYSAIIVEELSRANAASVGFCIHTDMVVPYLLRDATDEQKQRWLPRMVAGEAIGAIAMSEPGTGSDLSAVETTAIRSGDEYVLNGQKTFISNGILNEFVVVVAKTDPNAGSHGISLFLVERDMDGYERGRVLDKIGLHSQDTAELFFRNVRVPVENRIGGENEGFYALMKGLPRERLSMAVGAVASAEQALEWTVEYCQERQAFGRSIGKFQNSRFRLAEMKTEIEIGRVFVDHCILLYNEGELSAEKAAMAKWWTTDMQMRIIDQCLQLHGGYGYMMEYPIARAYVASRAQKIYGGTNEIMKEIIGRSMRF